jgi:hypothetical protein
MLPRYRSCSVRGHFPGLKAGGLQQHTRDLNVGFREIWSKRSGLSGRPNRRALLVGGSRRVLVIILLQINDQIAIIGQHTRHRANPVNQYAEDIR